MIRSLLKYFVISFAIMISCCVTSVDARSLACSYDITYTGYENREEKIQLIISDEDNGIYERWVKLDAGSKNPINNINSKSNYTNKLELNDFKDGDSYVCPKISYTIVKDDNNGFRVYVGNSDAGYLNSVSPSSDNSNNDITDDNSTVSDNQDNNINNNNDSTNPDSTNPASSPSPSPSDSLEKLEWEKVGEDVDATCEETMGELVDELQKYFDMIKIIAPILLIVFGALDFAGATLGMNNKDAMAKTTNKFVRRCIAALAIFFLPTLIEVVLTLPGLPEIENVLCGLK